MTPSEWAAAVADCHRKTNPYREEWLQPFNGWIKRNDPIKPKRKPMTPEQWQQRIDVCTGQLIDELNAIQKEQNPWRPIQRCWIETHPFPDDTCRLGFVVRFESHQRGAQPSQVRHYMTLRDLMRWWDIKIVHYDQHTNRWYCEPL